MGKGEVKGSSSGISDQLENSARSDVNGLRIPRAATKENKELEDPDLPNTKTSGVLQLREEKGESGKGEREKKKKSESESEARQGSYLKSEGG